MFQLTDFSLTYSQNKNIFSAVNLKLDLSKITLLTGENGSGKTSLLRVISGLHKKYSGKIFLHNKILRDYSIEDLAEKFLYLKQEPHANLVAATPGEDLAIYLHKFSKQISDEPKITKALQTFEMENFIDTPLWKLSGGQAKRIGLAALNLSENKYWVLDEPTSGLDASLQDKLVNLIKQHKAMGRGALIVSHRWEVFSKIADEIYEISDKKIERIENNL